jgi:hypothetical protein
MTYVLIIQDETNPSGFHLHEIALCGGPLIHVLPHPGAPLPDHSIPTEHDTGANQALSCVFSFTPSWFFWAKSD